MHCNNTARFVQVLLEKGSLGNDTTSMLVLDQAISMLLTVATLRIKGARNALWALLRSRCSTSRDGNRVEELVNHLNPLICTREDLEMLEFVIDYIGIPANMLLERATVANGHVVNQMIYGYLAEEGETGLKDTILMGERIGQQRYVDAKRSIRTSGLHLIRDALDDLQKGSALTPFDADQTLTAFVQEFERRLVRGVRPGRAGRSLEDVTGVILDHFGITGFIDAPEHIKTVFEVDKMIPLPDGWRIGVSCKRTLRERWKQAASLNEQRLDDEKIRCTLHVITYTSDLTIPKVRAIGESRGVVYIPDDDQFLKNHRDDPSISAYVRPMTAFISDLREAIQKSR